MEINTVTVLGANGTMGKNISAIFASFGSATVYMVCRTQEQAKQAVAEAAMLVRADTIKERLIPAIYDELNSFLPNSDLVFESVAEELEIKNSINKQVIDYLKEDAVFCTGTSGLSINQLANDLPTEVSKRYLGMHFFNPPYNMPLCEIIPNKNTDNSVKNDVILYLKEKLFRTVVEVKDEAAFLGNRIGFFFMNEALLFAKKYQERGGIDYIDTILGGFTGRNMPPIATADYVGLDVHKAIIENIYFNGISFSKESFITPNFLNDLIEQGKLGRKTGEGLYKSSQEENGEKIRQVFDIKTHTYREMKVYDMPFRKEVLHLLETGDYKNAWEVISAANSEEAKIARDFLIRYVIYSLYIAKKITPDLEAVDHVMAMGFNWIPPLAVIDAFGGKQKLLYMANEADLNYLNLDMSFIEDLIRKAPESKYDFRKFLKAR